MAGKALCGALTRRGGLCGRAAGWGTDHPGIGPCASHGVAQAVSGPLLASREPSVMGSPVEISPQEAILECVRIAAGEVAYASERIAELQADAALGPVRRSMVRKSDETGTVQEQRLDPPALHKWILVRQQAMDRLTHYSSLAVAMKLAVPIVQKDGIHAIADELAGRRARIAARGARAAHPQRP